METKLDLTKSFNSGTGSILKMFDMPTDDPRNFDDFALFIFSTEDDRTEIIDIESEETKMIFTADNYVVLPDGKRIGRIGYIPYSSRRQQDLLRFEALGENNIFSVKEMLCTHPDQRFDFEIEIYKSWINRQTQGV